MEPPVSNREAQLKREYADWYPGVEAGVWLAAEWVAGQVLEQLRNGEPRWAPSTRVLSDDHFAFRGGTADRPSGPRTRVSDEVSFGQEPVG